MVILFGVRKYGHAKSREFSQMRHYAMGIALALLLMAPGARADTFAPGSLIIPMDTTYQDTGMLKAYGLVYNLLFHGIPVRWVILPSKASQGVDFTVSATDVKSKAVIASHGYRGGPFVVDSADSAAAIPYIQAWWARIPSPLVAVHTATASFYGPVARRLVAAPRLAIHADGSQSIAVSYLNAASIPDSQGLPWPNTSPDLLTPAQVAGPTTTNHCDGALFDSSCNPIFCQFMSMHWAVTSAQASPETVAETRAFLNNPVHFFAECQGVDAFENTVITGTDGPGHFLTTNGLVAAPQPTSVDYYNPALTFAQLDGAFKTVGGSEPSYALAAGSSYKAGGIHMLTGANVAPGAGRDVWMTGYLDGACPPEAESCGSLGKVSYLGGHQYTTNTPISTNPSTQGVRLFLNSLFDSLCASDAGSPNISLWLNAPSGTTQPQVTYTISYLNGGPSVALKSVLTLPLPSGATFVSATGGGTFSGSTITWNLGNLGMGQSGSVSATVSFGGFATYEATAKLLFNVGLNPFTQASSPASTLYAACLTNADCASPTPRCDLSRNVCVQCLTDTDCSGSTPACGANNLCRACASDGDCGGATPACQPDGACGQCSATNSSACTGPYPICDVGTVTCISCNGDFGTAASAPCPSAAQPYCQASGACGSCGADVDCIGASHAGPYCRTATGACGVMCSYDGQCGTASWCDDLAAPGAGLCQPRVSNGQPVPGGTCTTVLGTRACLAGVCQPSDNTCGLASGSGPCTAQNAGVVCRSGVCATQGLNAGLCVQCADSSTCPSAAPACSTDANACVACNGDNGTGASAACPTPSAPFCTASGACGSCTIDADCAASSHAGSVCNATTGRCEIPSTDAGLPDAGLADSGLPLADSGPLPVDAAIEGPAVDAAPADGAPVAIDAPHETADAGATDLHPGDIDGASSNASAQSGCSCTTAGVPLPGTGALVLILALALALRRRRR